MLSGLLEPLQNDFIIRALFTGIFVGTACANLGVFLVLRRYALLGHGLTHVAFGGVAVGMLFSAQPFWSALVITALSSLGMLKLQEKARIHPDVAIGIVSAVGMAVGVVIASVAGGFTVDLMSYLFGSILTISPEEFWISLFISVLIIGFIAAFYHDLFALTFDEDSALAIGIKVKRFNVFFALISAVTIVIGMRVVGLLLISALIILPAVTSLQLSRSFRGSLLIATASVVVSVVAGIMISYFYDLPSGGTIVLLNFGLFLAASLINRFFLKHEGN